MPTGVPIIYKPKNGVLYEQPPHGTSMIAIEWLNYLMKNGYPDLQTGFNGGMCQLSSLFLLKTSTYFAR